MKFYTAINADELEYRPFENIEEAINAIKEHGGWVKNSLETCWLVTGYATKEDINKSVHIASKLRYLFLEIVWVLTS